MEFLLGFVLGMLVSSVIFVGYGYYTLRKMKKLKDKILDDLKNKLTEQDSKRDSIIARLKQAQAITEQQLDIRAATDEPSKNALHSRYKNGLIGDIKKLEEEKIAILKSILEDGFDPLISVREDSGELKELPLSHFINGSSTNKPDPNGPKRVGKFVVVKGGKDDGTVH
jgi:hypothetical protein